MKLSISKPLIKSGNFFDAVVVGGGLAGSHVAFNLSKLNLHVCVVDKESGYGKGASGNSRALAVPYISYGRPEASKFYETGIRKYFEHLTEVLSFNDIQLTDKGVIQIPSNSRISKVLLNHEDAGKQNEVFSIIDPYEASFLSGIKIEEKSLFYKTANSISPTDLIKANLNSQSKKIDFIPDFNAVEVKYSDNLWQIHASDKTVFTSKILVLCNTFMAPKLVDTLNVKLEPVKGQVNIVSKNDKIKNLQIPISFGAYILPVTDSECLLGSTYEHGNFDLEINKIKEDELLLKPGKSIISLQSQNFQTLSRRISIRSSTPDRLPYAGLYEPQNNEFSNLYISAGHGSRGVISSKISADIISSQVSGISSKELEDVSKLVNPNRFLRKNDER